MIKIAKRTTLTVKQLIESLERFPSDLPVFIFNIDGPAGNRYLNVVDTSRNQDSRAPIGIHIAAELD